MRVLLQIPPGLARDGVTVVTSMLEPLPALASRDWAEQRLRGDVPPGHVFRIDEVTEAVGRRGWPVILFAGQVLDERGAVAWHRVAAVYRFIYHAGVVELRAARPLGDDDRALLDLVLEAGPDFSGEVACLADVLGS
jgi:hypothetical protein